MEKRDQEQMEELVDMFVRATTQLGGKAIIISIDVGEGCLVSRKGEMFPIAQLMRETIRAIMEDVPRQTIPEFARVAGMKVVTTREEFDRLTNNEPGFEDFEMPPGSYTSKTIH